MKEINIAKVLVNKRKEKGITQDDLANYIGVSKASVSKWETGLSYPDITFLPQLATYFNISIDDLMCYEPQMTKEDIKKLYHKLSSDFTCKPFNDVMGNCREVIKKYYSCFPVLMYMGSLIVNHSMLSRSEEEKVSLIEEEKELFIRIRKEGEDIELSKQALLMEASCYLALGKPVEVLGILEGKSKTPLMMAEPLVAAAYQIMGKNTEAKSNLQVGIYQNIVSIFGFLPSYLMLCTDDGEKYEKTLERGILLSETFGLNTLHPALLFNFYLGAAQGYMIQGMEDKALNMLEKYTNLATGNIYPLRLHGDDFFDLIDEWLNELELGTAPPRDEKTIKEGMETAITNNPIFSSLQENIRFKRIAEKLKNNR